MLNLIIVLLGLKLLLPSRAQRKKRKKAKAHRKRLLWLVSLVTKKQAPSKVLAPAKKKMGLFRKIKLAVKTLMVICISIPLIDLTIKGVKLGQKAYALLPKKPEA